MSLPWFQVERTSKAKAGYLAALLNIHRREAQGLLWDLWEFALDWNKEGPPECVIPANAATRVIAAACEWPASKAQALISGLRQAGFLEVTRGQVRVLGLNRYENTWRRYHGVNADGSKRIRENRAATARPPRGNRALDGDETRIEDLFAGAVPVDPPVPVGSGVPTGQGIPDSPATPPSPQNAVFDLGEAQPLQAPPIPPRKAQEGKAGPPGPSKAKGETDPLHRPLVEALMAVFSDVMGAGYSFTSKDGQAVKQLLARTPDIPEHARRFRLCLNLNRFPGCTDLHTFQERWNAFARAQDSSRAPASNWSDARTSVGFEATGAAEFRATGTEYVDVSFFPAWASHVAG